jgi:hypothetical protein
MVRRSHLIVDSTRSRFWVEYGVVGLGFGIPIGVPFLINGSEVPYTWLSRISLAALFRSRSLMQHILTHDLHSRAWLLIK